MGTATIKGTTSGIDGADALVGIEVAWTTDSGALTIGNAPPATNRAVLTSEANTTGLTDLTAGIGKVFTGQSLANFTTATGLTFSTGSDTSDGNYYCYSRIWEKNGSTYQVSEWTTNGAIPSDVRITSASKSGPSTEITFTFSADDAVSFDLVSPQSTSVIYANIVSPQIISSESDFTFINALKASNGFHFAISDDSYIFPFVLEYGSIPFMSSFYVNTAPNDISTFYDCVISCANGRPICGYLIDDNPTPPLPPYTLAQGWIARTPNSTYSASGYVTSTVGTRPLYAHILRDNYTVVSHASADVVFSENPYDILNGYYSYGDTGGGFGNFGPVQLNLVDGQTFSFDYSAVMMQGYLFFNIVRASDSASILAFSLDTGEYEVIYDEADTVAVTIPTSGLYNISWGIDYTDATELIINNFIIPEA